MRRSNRLASLGSILMAVLFASSAMAEPVVFTLANGSDDTLMEFYASPPDVEEWEEDILGEETLAPGEEVQITIADGRYDCSYDFRAVFETEDGDQYEVVHDAVEVCDGETYVYTP